MTADEIIAGILAGLIIASLFVLLIFGLKSAEKTEEKKRAFLEEISKYYRHRNEQFEEDKK